jgi:hypothetical protein
MMVWMDRGGSRSLPLSSAASEFLAGGVTTEASGRAACRYFIEGIECVTRAGSAIGAAVVSASKDGNKNNHQNNQRRLVGI